MCLTSRVSRRPRVTLGHGDVLIAAITSCTNTSNPSVMLAAGLLAKKAVERGLAVGPAVKTSLAPGSRVVTAYLDRDRPPTLPGQAGFSDGRLRLHDLYRQLWPARSRGIEEAVNQHDVVAASAFLSGNRNFEARVHQSIKANFLMSPPLVVALALAGRVNIDLTTEPLGQGAGWSGRSTLHDIWPSQSGSARPVLYAATDPATYQRLYTNFTEQNPLWNEVPSTLGEVYEWDTAFNLYSRAALSSKNSGSSREGSANLKNARALAIFGDSVTTDHISPAGAIKKELTGGPVFAGAWGSLRGF